MNKALTDLGACALAFLSLAIFSTHAEAQHQSQLGLYQARSAYTAVPAAQFIPGHYRITQERVFIPGYTRQVYVPARYENRCGLFGIQYRRKVSPAHYRSYREPGRYEIRTRKVWIPGSYTY